MKKTVVSNYELAAEAVAREFLKKYYEDVACPYSWVGDRVGGLLWIEGRYLDKENRCWGFGDCVDALRFNVSKEKLFDWADKASDAFAEDKEFPPLFMWIKSAS